MLENRTLQVKVSKYWGRKEETRGDSSIYGNTTKDVIEKTGAFFMEKSTGVWWCIKYTPKKCSNRRKGIEDQMESSHICKV